MLINNYKATLISSSRFHAKLNKKEILGTFVTLTYSRVSSLLNFTRVREKNFNYYLRK